MIEKVAMALGEINDEVIYVGGAIIELYATEKGADKPRPTTDIDISVQISSYAQMEQLRQKLAIKGICPDPQGKIIYRYIYENILIDIIPFEETSLGPTNRWLKPGFKQAYPVRIGRSTIKILPVSLYLATKWEAFKERGGDPRASHDFEDIIFVLDNNSGLLENILSAGKEVRTFLKKMTGEILSDPYRNEIIECHLNPVTADARRKFIVEKLRQILELA